jgi:hypothetical protein
MEKPTFRVMKQALLDLGFVQVPLDRPGFQFDYPPYGTFFRLRPFAEDELVDLPNLVAVTRLLDMHGIIGEAEFEAMLRERSLAG